MFLGWTPNDQRSLGWTLRSMAARWLKPGWNRMHAKSLRVHGMPDEGNSEDALWLKPLTRPMP